MNMWLNPKSDQDLDTVEQLNILLFNQSRRQGLSKQKKVKVYYIGVQSFARPPETWHTKQTCWHTFTHSVCDFLYPD